MTFTAPLLPSILFLIFLFLSFIPLPIITDLSYDFWFLLHYLFIYLFTSPHLICLGVTAKGRQTS